MKRAAVLLAALALTACAASVEPDAAAFLDDVAEVDGVDAWLVTHPDHDLPAAATNVVCESEPALSEPEVHDVLALAYPDLVALPGVTPALIESAETNLCV